MLNQEIRKLVFARANNLCEYCRSPLSHSLDPFDVEHIIPLSKNGTNKLRNLASSCRGCNGHKYNKTHAIDPMNSVLVSLYNPRTMDWKNHFTWSSDFTEIIGISPSGRATVKALHLNRQGTMNVRRLLLLVGLHPPKA